MLLLDFFNTYSNFGSSSDSFPVYHRVEEGLKYPSIINLFATVGWFFVCLKSLLFYPVLSKLHIIHCYFHKLCSKLFKAVYLVVFN